MKRAALLVLVPAALGIMWMVLSRSSRQRPNVLLVTFDSLRADHLGAYGYERNTSPNIDGIARQAYVFTDCVSQCGSTACSLPSLHTSKFPQLDELRGSKTLAQLLRSNGYDTYAVVSHDFAESRYVGANGFIVYDEDYSKPGQATETVERVIRLLEGREQPGSPFFLWIHFREPHRPYTPQQATFELFYPPTGDPLISSFRASEFDLLPEALEYYTTTQGENVISYSRGGRTIPLTQTLLKQVTALYDANIFEVDDQFGRIVRFFKRSGLYKSTVVIIGADHADALGEQGVIGHNDLLYAILHTPLIVRTPTNRHEIIDYEAMNVDVLPTVLALVGIAVPPSTRGRNLLERAAPGYQYAAYKDDYIVKQQGFKIRVANDVIVELTNVTVDPQEQNNLLPSQPARTQILQSLYHSLGGNRGMNEEDTIKMLKSLGYIQ